MKSSQYTKCFQFITIIFNKMLSRVFRRAPLDNQPQKDIYDAELEGIFSEKYI